MRGLIEWEHDTGQCTPTVRKNATEEPLRNQIREDGRDRSIAWSADIEAAVFSIWSDYTKITRTL
jgi:hypothetical protein